MEKYTDSEHTVTEMRVGRLGEVTPAYRGGNHSSKDGAGAQGHTPFKGGYCLYRVDFKGSILPECNLVSSFYFSSFCISR